MAEEKDIYAGALNTLQFPSFEGASTDYRNAHRKAILADADALAVGELKFLQSRCRHIIRNNPSAATARNKYVSSSGEISVKWKDSSGKLVNQMQDLWEAFEENCSLDGKGNLASFYATLKGDKFESGEYLCRMLVFRDGRSKIPLKLQGIESEYLDIGYFGHGEDGNVLGKTRYGITFDPVTMNIPETYNFFQERHFGVGVNLSQSQYVKVPADEILHGFKRLRSNQWRGVPLLAPCLILLYSMEDLLTATVRVQISASAIAWVVSELNSINLDPAGTVGLLGKNSFDDTVKQLHFDTSGGTVQYTNGQFNLVQSRDVGNNLNDLFKYSERKLSACLNIPYHLFTGDTDGLNFSSIRAILSEYRSNTEFDLSIVDIPDFYAPLTRRFKDMALALGYKVNRANPTFEFPRWYGTDDLKDSQADLLEVMSFQRPIQSVWAERGYTEEEIAESKATLERMGLWDFLLKQGSQAQNNSTPKSNTTGS